MNRNKQLDFMVAAFLDLPPVDRAVLLRRLDEQQERVFIVKFPFPCGTLCQPSVQLEYQEYAQIPESIGVQARWLFVEPRAHIPARFDVTLWRDCSPIDLIWESGVGGWRCIGKHVLLLPREAVLLRVTRKPGMPKLEIRVTARLECAVLSREGGG